MPMQPECRYPLSFPVKAPLYNEPLHAAIYTVITLSSVGQGFPCLEGVISIPPLTPCHPGHKCQKVLVFVLNGRGGQHDEGAGMRPGRSREEAA